MGMFDNVNFKMKCPKCRFLIDNFQSKDGSCLMVTLDFWEVGNFYGGCSKCNSWVEFTLKSTRPNRKLTLKDYKKEVRISTKKEEKEHKDKYKRFAKLLAKDKQEVKK